MCRRKWTSKYRNDTSGLIKHRPAHRGGAYTLLLLLVLLLGSTAAFAQQSRKDLEDRRKKLLKEIEQTTALLGKTKKEKETTLSVYVTLQKQINKRRQLIETLQAEVQYLTANLERTADVVIALTGDIERLKLEYATMIRHAYRQRLSSNDWLFLFSSRSFNDAFRRWQYLRQYDRYRQKQARLILETQLTLLDKIKLIEERKHEKEKLLDSERRQSEMLGLEMLQKNRMLETLKGDEARLAFDLERKREAASKLDAAIEKVIREEMERASREERTAAAAAGSTAAKPLATPESVIASKDFQNNRGKLPWPVKSGVITGYFGRQPHPAIQSVEIVNNGIDIRTNEGESVRAVFDGTVVGTQFIPGHNYMVILKHGEYYTVYSNLEEVSVKKGDQVAIRQNIGKVSTDRKTNTTEVHFEIWKEKTRLNPQVWVGKQ